MGRSKPTKIEERRLRAAELMRARPGISIRALARALGCGQNTALRDMQAIRAEWAARRSALYESRAAEDLDRTDAAIAALWPQVLAGKGWAVDRLVSLLAYRAKVLGLESQRQELDIGQTLAAYLERLAEGGDAPPA
jgi:predicted DNA-binding transcriptional regulator YafY